MSEYIPRDADRSIVNICPQLESYLPIWADSSTRTSTTVLHAMGLLWSDALLPTGYNSSHILAVKDHEMPEHLDCLAGLSVTEMAARGR